MKELSIEQKAKAYDEALERAREWHNDPHITIGLKGNLEDIFPELKESEDERMKKSIIQTLKKYSKCVEDGNDSPSAKDFLVKDIENQIAWLEKQGETSTILSNSSNIGVVTLSEEEQNRFAQCVLTSCASSFIDYLDAHKYEGKMCVSNGECEDIENAFHNAMWDRLYRYYCKYIEKQGEQKPIMNVPTREVILSIWDLGNEWKELTNGSISTEYGTQLDYIQKHWYESEYYLREKQGEQNPAVVDFNAKDWYVSKVDGKIHDMTYNSTDKVEPKFKIGDVLCDKSCTTLNKNSQPNIKILDIRNDMYICNNCSFPISQQDEYELVTKKIEPQSAWSDEDDYNLQCMIAKVTSDIQKGNVGRNNELIDWLKSLKDRVQPQPKQEWSEEDEKMIGRIRSIVEKYAFSQSAVDANGDLCEKEYIDADNWLKSLRHQKQWKPSEEQIKTCKEVYADILSAKGFDLGTVNNELNRLEEQLKKLTE